MIPTNKKELKFFLTAVARDNSLRTELDDRFISSLQVSNSKTIQKLTAAQNLQSSEITSQYLGIANMVFS
jgi:hypothetical protein